MKPSPNTTLHVKLLTEELVLKVEKLRSSGYNVPALVRNFLNDFLEQKEVA